MAEVLVWPAAMAVACSASAIGVAAIKRYRPRWMRMHGDAACIAAVVVGAILGHTVLRLWPHWPPASALDRFLTIVLPATVILLLIGRWSWRSRGLTWAFRLLFALLVGRVLLHRSVYLQDDMAGSIVVLAASAGILVTVQCLLTGLWIRTRQASLPLAVAAALFSAGLLVLMAGYIKGGCAAFPWSAALAGAIMPTCWSKKRADLQGLMELAIVLLFGILFIGRFFGGLTTGCALLVLITPLFCWVPELPVFRRCLPWQKECVRMSLVAAILLAILLSAKVTFDREMAPLLGEVRPPSTCRVETVLDANDLIRADTSRTSGKVGWRSAPNRDSGR